MSCVEVAILPLVPLRLPRRRDIAFTESVKSHRVVVEHFSCELIGQIFARFYVRQVVGELVALATLLRASSVGWIF
jgi:hypothetical protein